MWGGFTEEGIKTIVPAAGRAKLACRLVPDQAPEVSPSPHVHALSVHAVRTSRQPLTDDSRAAALSLSPACHFYFHTLTRLEAVPLHVHMLLA